ncbi:hypothetical protein E4U12_005804 [Claviceps purpurea]|nr:hypothetical protein E4U12_005804 [Claviceps purpurea]KAG6185566.1 hypothetical protein E4U36_001243 [Claviceps purpurea]
MMQDSLQPDSATLEQYYERGYRLWHVLYLAALSSPLDATALDFQHAFPSHPYLVPELRLDTRSNGTLYATGTSTWQTSTGDCSLPSFEKKYKIPVTAGDSVIVSLQLYHGSFGQDGGHISLLMLAWAYVLSQRWSELIPGAEAIKYTNSSSALSETGGGFKETDGPVVDLGIVTDEAVRWWAAVLAPGEGWAARIHHRGEDLRSPWSVRLQSSKELTLCSRNTLSPGDDESPPSFSTAVQYIADYAKYHGVEDQSRAAFAAALLLPARRSISKTFRWPRPAWHNKPPELSAEQCWPPWGEDNDQLDKLITMSCNVIGMLSLLCSSFVDPDLPCNVSGAWMQGAFAVLDEPEAKKPDVLRSMLLKRSPTLGFLWLGAILLDMQGRIMACARPVVYTTDLHSTAWTATFGTFFQRPVADYPPNTETIQRADEARLMFLSQAESHSELPLVPFPPFGTIAVRDCVLEVQLHASCSGSHGLLYAGWTWDCLGNVKVAQDSGSRLLEFGDANEHPAASMAIRFDKLDQDQDISVLMTTNIFTWLREQDGWPVAERGIRDCLDENFMSDDYDDESAAPEGDGKSTTYRRNVGPWVSRAVTTRSRTM